MDLLNVQFVEKSTGFIWSAAEVSISYARLEPTCKKKKNDWSFYAAFPSGERGQKKKWEVRGNELQETPDRSPVFLLIYPSLLSAGLLRVRQYFHIVLLNTMWPYLLPSPQTAIAYLQQQFAQPEWTEKTYWSSIRWNMELSETVTPPAPQHCVDVCVCVF